jgi:hypothetical protein
LSSDSEIRQTIPDNNTIIQKKIKQKFWMVKQEIQIKLIRPCLRHFSIEDLNGKIIAAHSIAL